MTNRYLADPHPVFAALTAPLVRVWELGVDGKLVAGIIGLVGAISGDLTVLLMGVLMVS